MVTWLASFFAAVGAINWGLTKFFDFNLVEYLNNMTKIDYFMEVMYGIISFAGLYSLVRLFV